MYLYHLKDRQTNHLTPTDHAGSVGVMVYLSLKGESMTCSQEITSRLDKAIEVYQPQIDTWKELGSKAPMDIKEIYRRISLRFLHSCVDAMMSMRDIPWMVDILPFKKFLKEI